MVDEKNAGSVDEAASSIEKLRTGIDEADKQIVQILSKRARLAQEIGAVKARSAQKAYAPARERQLLERLAEANQGPLSQAALTLIYKEIISACLSLERPLKIAYLGPEGTFTHAATKRHFGMSVQITPKKVIPDIFADVERNRCDYGVVPIENSTEGVVNHTLDAFMNSDLVICAEVVMEVSHHVLTAAGEGTRITKVYSHPQALAQCRVWLEHNLPGVPLIDVSSTARAAQLAAEDPSAAAVASDLAANIHGLLIAHNHVEDLQGNMTRFLVLGRQSPDPTGDDRTSIMFALKDSPGVLYDALAPFSKAGINMSRIESRPSRQRAWEYLFFIDLEGHRADERISKAIEELSKACVFMKVLGSYPRGKLDEHPPRTVEQES